MPKRQHQTAANSLGSCRVLAEKKKEREREKKKEKKEKEEESPKLVPGSDIHWR